MATAIIPGQTDWRLVRDEEGNREYRIKFKILANSPRVGPAEVLLTPGLPLPGTPWIVDNDFDLWAWCRADCTITPLYTGEPNRHWEAEYRFSTKPPSRDSGQSGGNPRCQDSPVEDPLLEPAKISGSFAKFTEEATRDRFGRPILTSSHEQIRGPQVEFDDSRPTVKIERNVAVLNLGLLSSMRDTVNAFPLWGQARRCVKLSNVSWDKKLYGLCYVYYTWVLEFEINSKTFDRNLLDEGTKALNGHWDDSTGLWVLDNIAGVAPDKNNPAHFSRFKDRAGENTRVILDGNGLPYNPDPTELEKWYCLNYYWDVNASPTCFFGKCSEAYDAAFEAGAYLSGPYADEAACSDACIVANYEDSQDIDDFYNANCPPTTRNSPGSIRVEKYRESNFALLGIPLVLI